MTKLVISQSLKERVTNGLNNFDQFIVNAFRIMMERIRSDPEAY
jgi:hypothetical protein